MKLLAILCMILPLAGCFAWDMDEKQYPWSPDPGPEDTSIGTVVWYGDKEPMPPPQAPTYMAEPARGQVPPAPAAQPLRETVEVEVEPAVQAEPVAPPAAAPAPASDADKRLDAMEQRMEELYQLMLKSMEKKNEEKK